MPTKIYVIPDSMRLLNDWTERITVFVILASLLAIAYLTIKLVHQ